MTLKDSARAPVIAARKAMDEADRTRARAAIAGHVRRWCRDLGLAPGAPIACYQPLRTEPGSVQLLAGLDEDGYRVLVPITLGDFDLDWQVWADGATRPDPLGTSAISTAAVILVPAFSVDRRGNRLGRGGGSYDRALARVADSVPVAALLFDGELVDEVPTEAWDRPVSAVVTPSGWTNLIRS